VSIKGRSVFTIEQAKLTLTAAFDARVQPVTPSNSFSIPPASSTVPTQADPRSSHRSGEGDSASVSAAVAVLKEASVHLFETVCQIRGDELDDTGNYEVVHHIRGKATLDELTLGSVTRREVKQLLIWDLWLASERKQLDARQKQEVFVIPCPAPPSATVLRSH
jgi:hypothetical protein